MIRNAGEPRRKRTARPGTRRAAFSAWVRPARGRRDVGGWRKPLRIASGAAILLALLLGVNWIYQVIRKPSELLFPIRAAKQPADTWRSYAALFRRNSTRAISPEFLAALAQAEGAGDPFAHTYWRWSWAAKPFDLYRPASSSVGMYQMTDGTFAEARNYCIRDHHAVVDGDAHACGFDRRHLRILPTDAIELTAAFLDRSVAGTLARNGITGASIRQRQHLAATIHLCGAGTGELYARRGFRFTAGQRCALEDPRAYIARVDEYEREFAAMAAQDALAPGQ
jgi:hypothetical protein